jgi:hypothetical protein
MIGKGKYNTLSLVREYGFQGLCGKCIKSNGQWERNSASIKKSSVLDE